MNEQIKDNMSVDNEKTYFGFWVYLMTDCVLFASLFAVFVILRSNMSGGPTSELFSLPFVLVETLILLISSFTCGLGRLAVSRANKKMVLTWFSATLLLGVTFLTLELTEFRHLVNDGNSWRTNSFLSAYFTLVGTHGLHIAIGLLWLVVLLVLVYKKGLRSKTEKGLNLLSVFWHFLDIIWIFIFTIVYLMGSIKK